MAYYDIESKIGRLSNVLKNSGCENPQPVIDFVRTMLYEDRNFSEFSRSDIKNLYRNTFFKEISQSEAEFEAYRLDIRNVKSKVILVGFASNCDVETIVETIDSIIESKNGQNYTVPVGHNCAAIIYDISAEDDSREFSMALTETLAGELGVNIVVGIGNSYENFIRAKESYLKAELALGAGKIILDDSNVYEYDKLGAVKVVYNMTEDQCRTFLEETFNEETQKELEGNEMLESINTFFKYNLNISVTARELYIHRNTLVYRIEKFNKISGYNLSDFNDACTVKFALMVRRKLLG